MLRGVGQTVPHQRARHLVVCPSPEVGKTEMARPESSGASLCGLELSDLCVSTWKLLLDTPVPLKGGVDLQARHSILGGWATPTSARQPVLLKSDPQFTLTGFPDPSVPLFLGLSSPTKPFGTCCTPQPLSCVCSVLPQFFALPPCQVWST